MRYRQAAEESVKYVI